MKNVSVFLLFPVFLQSCVNLTGIVSGFILTSVSYQSSHIKLNPMNSGLVLNFKPEALHCTWRPARLSNKVLSRRQEILEKSNNVMTMFITFTVRPGCTSAQHQTLVRPTERKPFFSWQRFAPARCYHFTGIFSPNKKKITHLYMCVCLCIYICIYIHTCLQGNTQKYLYTHIFLCC